jgi:hypothetical protein
MLRKLLKEDRLAFRSIYSELWDDRDCCTVSNFLVELTLL